MRLDREQLHRLELALSREWLETDGRGGYASSTVLGCPTRRFHGLLVARPDGHRERHVFLSRFEEKVHGHGRHFLLSLTRYRGTFIPDGDLGLEEFSLVPWPRWTFRMGLAVIEREILMPRGERTVLLRYRNVGERAGLRLTLRPLLACREARGLTFENLSLDSRIGRSANGLVLRPYAALPAVHMSAVTSAGAPNFEADPLWYRGIEYTQDQLRGYDCHEDHFCPGWCDGDFAPGAEWHVAASIEGPIPDPAAAWQAASERRLAEGRAWSPGFRGQLEAAGEAFFFRNEAARLGLIAGYPWFEERGRHSFVALPGLTLARGRIEEARELLLAALPYLRDGLLPNIYGQSPQDSEYTAADAALWFALAVGRCFERITDRDSRQRLVAAVRSIEQAYRQGTQLGIWVDREGLLHAGDERSAVTWMDASTNEGPVTPRHGMAVELNALWVYLLQLLARLEPSPAATAEAQRVGQAFVRRFWSEEQGYLADVINEERVDLTVRPNQIIAAALPGSPLSEDQRAWIVRRVEAELLTPRGLRTLSPTELPYRGRYVGPANERDRAAHQGCVWPWLMGFYVEAVLRAFPGDKHRAEQLVRLIDGFEECLHSHGLGQIPKLFDGDPPHRPGGAIAQAWSVGELLRAKELLAAAQRGEWPQ